MQYQELLKILENFHGLTPSMLYNDMVVLDRVESSFDDYEVRKFIALFIFSQHNNLSKDSYSRAIKNSTKIPEKLDEFKRKLKDAFPDWLSISGPGVQESEETIKLYLSVDNSDIHYFANRLLYTSIDREYDDFDFKINNNQDINRSDNVVIYCTPENIGRYIQTVSEILEQSPDIKLNSPHVLGIPYDDKIYCGVDHNNGTISHTEAICESIFNSLRKCEDKELIVSMVDHQLRRQTPRIQYLANESLSSKNY